MKFSACALLLASSAAAARLSFFGNDQHVLDEPFPIPGKNPLLYCEDPSDYILNVTKVDLNPNPPTAGKALVIEGTGSVKQKIEEGAKINVQVKYGVIRLINQQLDLCDYASEADLECPLNEGKDLKINKSVDLPREIPPGRYTVLADVRTKDDEAITCFTATVVFGRGGAAQVEDL